MILSSRRLHHHLLIDIVPSNIPSPPFCSVHYPFPLRIFPTVRFELLPPLRWHHRSPRIHRGRLSLGIGKVQLGLPRGWRPEWIHLLIVVHAGISLQQAILALIEFLHARHRLLRREQLLVSLDLGLLGQLFALRALGGYDAQLLLEALQLLRLDGIDPRLGIVAISFPFQLGYLRPAFSCDDNGDEAWRVATLCFISTHIEILT